MISWFVFWKRKKDGSRKSGEIRIKSIAYLKKEKKRKPLVYPTGHFYEFILLCKILIIYLRQSISRGRDSERGRSRLPPKQGA